MQMFFKIGATVSLKGEKRAMTVIESAALNTTCTWLADQGQPFTVTYPTEALRAFPFVVTPEAAAEPPTTTAGARRTKASG